VAGEAGKAISPAAKILGCEKIVAKHSSFRKYWSKSKKLKPPF